MITGRQLSVFQQPTQLKNLTTKIIDNVYYIHANEPTSQLAFYFKDRNTSILDEVDNGMFGVVLYGYLLHHQAAGVPHFAVKRFHTLCTGENKEHVINCMKNEVTYHRILNRVAYYFLVGDVGFIFYPWQTGIRIRDFVYNKYAITPLQILSVISDLLKQLQRLHDANIKHGDLSDENVLIDPLTFHGSIVDLGSAAINSQPSTLEADMKSISHLMASLIDRLAPEKDNNLLTDLCHQLKQLTASAAINACNELINNLSTKHVQLKPNL